MQDIEVFPVGLWCGIHYDMLWTRPTKIAVEDTLFQNAVPSVLVCTVKLPSHTGDCPLMPGSTRKGF